MRLVLRVIQTWNDPQTLPLQEPVKEGGWRQVLTAVGPSSQASVFIEPAIFTPSSGYFAPLPSSLFFVLMEPGI